MRLHTLPLVSLPVLTLRLPSVSKLDYITHSTANTVFNSKWWYQVWIQCLSVLKSLDFFFFLMDIKQHSNVSIYTFTHKRISGNAGEIPTDRISCILHPWQLYRTLPFSSCLESNLLSKHSHSHRQNLHCNDVLSQFQAFGGVVFQWPFIKLEIPEEQKQRLLMSLRLGYLTLLTLHVNRNVL